MLLLYRMTNPCDMLVSLSMSSGFCKCTVLLISELYLGTVFFLKFPTPLYNWILWKLNGFRNSNVLSNKFPEIVMC